MQPNPMDYNHSAKKTEMIWSPAQTTRRLAYRLKK